MFQIVLCARFNTEELLWDDKRFESVLRMNDGALGQLVSMSGVRVPIVSCFLPRPFDSIKT